MSGEVLIFCVFLEHVVKLLTIKGAQFWTPIGARIDKNSGLEEFHRGGYPVRRGPPQKDYFLLLFLISELELESAQVPRA